MSKSKAQVHELMCRNLAAECEELAADVVEPDIKPTYFVWHAIGRTWRISLASCIEPTRVGTPQKLNNSYLQSGRRAARNPPGPSAGEAPYLRRLTNPYSVK